jgi:mannose-6-phosphate isomerase-like protein (cupin superfamily)
MNPGFHATLADLVARIPTHDNKRFAVAFQRGTLTLELYAPLGRDSQTPHAQDEVYVVVSGQGEFRCGKQVTPFGPGDILFVPAGVEHRFERFSNDLVVWVIFYGPTGGETETRSPD